MHLPVRRLEEDRQRSVVDRARAGEERGKRIVLGWELLASEEEQRDVVSAVRLRRQVSNELEGNCDSSFHVTGAQPVYRAELDTPRDVRLSGDGVVVPGEQDERNADADVREERGTRRRGRTRR